MTEVNFLQVKKKNDSNKIKRPIFRWLVLLQYLNLNYTDAHVYVKSNFIMVRLRVFHKMFPQVDTRTNFILYSQTRQTSQLFWCRYTRLTPAREPTCYKHNKPPAPGTLSGLNVDCEWWTQNVSFYHVVYLQRF